MAADRNPRTQQPDKVSGIRTERAVAAAIAWAAGGKCWSGKGGAMITWRSPLGEVCGGACIGGACGESALICPRILTQPRLSAGAKPRGEDRMNNKETKEQSRT